MYISGEIAGNTSPRSEPIITPLVDHFEQIERKFGERFGDDFWDELTKLERDMGTEMSKASRQTVEASRQRMKYPAALDTQEALSEPKFGPALDEEATVPEQPTLQHEPRHDIESVFCV